MLEWQQVNVHRAGEHEHTRIGDTDADIAAEKALLIKRKSLLQIVLCGELCVSEALGAALGAILDDANIGNIAASGGEELGHGLLVCIVGQIAKVCSVGRLVGKGKLLSLLTGVTYRSSC